MFHSFMTSKPLNPSTSHVFSPSFHAKDQPNMAATINLGPFFRSRFSNWFPKPQMPDVALPDHDAADNEVNILQHHKSSGEVAVPQRIPFTTLPAEIRNHIYELALPSSEKELIVAAPFKDDLMALAVQPPITQTTKQLRSEILPMFYSDRTFVAYIKDFDFTPLVNWAGSITSTTQSPQITVEVQIKLLSRITSAYQLGGLIRYWRDINSSTLHLKVHNCYTSGLGRVPRIKGFDQRKLVADAFNCAEELRQRGDFSEKGWLEACDGLFESVDREFLIGDEDGPDERVLAERIKFFERYGGGESVGRTGRTERAARQGDKGYMSVFSALEGGGGTIWDSFV